MNCSNCGNFLESGQTVCSRCGQQVSGQVSSQMVYNNQFVNNNYSNSSGGMTNRQKTIIIILLLVVISLLGVAAFVISKDDKGNRVYLDDGTRTVMIYMVGSNLETDSMIATSDLEKIDPDSIDLEKTNILLYTGGTTEWHNFIKNDENAIFLLTEDGFEKIETYSKDNMGSYKTLLNFLDYSYENFETQYYDLVLYNHGGAIQGAIYDDFTNDNLSLNEFDKALKESEFNEENKLNTVLFRTCLNGTIEVANTFSPYAKYLIASEEVTLGGTGYSVLKYLNDVNDSDDAISYGKKFINAYDEQIEAIDPSGYLAESTYSIIDLSKMNDVNQLLDEFISSIDLEDNYRDIVRIRSHMYQYGYTTYDVGLYDTVDLYTLVNELSSLTNKSSDELLKAIDEAIVYNWSDNTDSKGLSIYFPYNAKQVEQSMFLSIYEDFKDDSDAYYDFIKKFNALSTSNNVSSFAKTDVSKNNTTISGDEFSLQLTDEQKQDYSESIYIVFRKDDEGLYNPIYSSDNTILTDEGVLKTNISDNLIKVYDKSDPNDKGEYISLVERGSSDNRSLSSVVILNHFGEDNDFEMAGSTAYFEIKNNIPSIYKYINIDSDAGTSAVTLNPDDYEVIDFISSSYNILDSKGNYTDDWDNNGVISFYELKIKDMGLKKASLSDDEDYYCVFKIKDIYGNVYYSKLLNLK